MPLRLDRVSIIDQVTNSIRQAVVDGEWQGWLPGERRLSMDLRVGRNTLRAALKSLAKEGLVEIVPGQGSRIVAGSPHVAAYRKQAIGLLTPGPIEALFPRQILWIDALRDYLSKIGYILKSFHGAQFFQTNPARSISRLVSLERCGCWILVSSSKATQEWFSANKIPCLIAGSCHNGIKLPFVDIDYRALCRHAATTLLRLGHRNIVYLAPPPQLAGDIQSEAGFIEGIESLSADTSVKGQIAHIDLESDQCVGTVKRLMNRNGPPTAMLVHNAFLYLTTFSTLTQMGLNVPNHISLICRESENFLPYLKPTPASYSHNPLQFADKLTRIADKLIINAHIQTKSTLLMPDFVKGQSVSSIKT